MKADGRHEITKSSQFKKVNLGTGCAFFNLNLKYNGVFYENMSQPLTEND